MVCDLKDEIPTCICTVHILVDMLAVWLVYQASAV